MSEFKIVDVRPDTIDVVGLPISGVFPLPGDGKNITRIANDSTILFLDSGVLYYKCPPPFSNTVLTLSLDISSVAIDPSGRYVATRDLGDSNVKLYNIDEKGVILRETSVIQNVASESGQFYFTDDQKYLLVGYVNTIGDYVLSSVNVDTEQENIIYTSTTVPLNSLYLRLISSGKIFYSPETVVNGQPNLWVNDLEGGAEVVLAVNDTETVSIEVIIPFSDATGVIFACKAVTNNLSIRRVLLSDPLVELEISTAPIEANFQIQLSADNQYSVVTEGSFIFASPTNTGGANAEISDDNLKHVRIVDNDTVVYIDISKNLVNTPIDSNDKKIMATDVETFECTPESIIFTTYSDPTTILLKEISKSDLTVANTLATYKEVLPLPYDIKLYTNPTDNYQGIYTVFYDNNHISVYGTLPEFPLLTNELGDEPQVNISPDQSAILIYNPNDKYYAGSVTVRVERFTHPYFVPISFP